MTRKEAEKRVLCLRRQLLNEAAELRKDCPQGLSAEDWPLCRAEEKEVLAEALATLLSFLAQGD